MEFSFVFLGDPIAKGRPRTGRGVTYTPARTRKAEKEIREYVADLVDVPFDVPVHISLTFYCKTARRTDLDNLEKLVCDALNGLAYTDDHLIHSKTSRLHRKALAEPPRTEVRIHPIQGAEE